VAAKGSPKKIDRALETPMSRKNTISVTTERTALRRLFREKLLLLLVAFMAVKSAALALAPSCRSQQPPASTADAATPPAFEVAAIKLNQSGSGGSHSTTNNSRFIATNVSLKSLMEYQAYGIPSSQILGGPKWLDSTRFDLEAKMYDYESDHLRSLTRDQRRLETQSMFQQVLADRFKLAVHWETRELPVFALVVVKKGSKLQPARGSTEESGTSSNSSRSGSQFSAKGITLSELAAGLTRELSKELGRDIIDQTEITGRYDLTLKWTPDAVAVSEGADSPADAGPSIFTAIQEQLGLKLEPAKAPIQVLVIDHVEMPSQN
jgi:uncharacterized protein (TIGR03435 family)